MARGFFSTPMTEDTIVEFGTVMKLLSLMNVNHVGQSDHPERQTHRRRHARPHQRSIEGIRNFYRKYAGSRGVNHSAGAICLLHFGIGYDIIKL